MRPGSNLFPGETRPGGRNPSFMEKELSGRTIAILVTDGFEQVEMTEPRNALNRAGAKTILISPRAGEVQGMNHSEKGDKFKVDQTLASVASDDFDALLPGGVANPDKLRTIPDAVKFVSSFGKNKSRSPQSATVPGCWWRRAP